MHNNFRGSIDSQTAPQFHFPKHSLLDRVYSPATTRCSTPTTNVPPDSSQRSRWRNPDRYKPRTVAALSSLRRSPASSPRATPRSRRSLRPFSTRSEPILLIVFIVLIFAHRGITDALERATYLKQLNLDAAARLGRDWQNFPVPPTPVEFRDHATAKDLDLLARRPCSNSSTQRSRRAGGNGSPTG